MTGYYSEIFFQSKGVRYIALSDGFDSLGDHNEVAPFKNILNDMYARDISKKIKTAKKQRAKQGLFIGSQTPYGYQKDPNNRNRLIVDPTAAETVRLIFSLAEQGLGYIAIADDLKRRGIDTPSVYKFKQGDTRFKEFTPVKTGSQSDWCDATVGSILRNSVYIGELSSLKTEVINYKTSQQISVPKDRQIVTPNAHEAIIDIAQFERVQQIRATHSCPAYA
ncbi:MAG: recombinase family protein, partial [Lachnospiraceae bacterium]|nr:recombinase family protein [Lachnospiraceae bacterium]